MASNIAIAAIIILPIPMDIIEITGTINLESIYILFHLKRKKDAALNGNRCMKRHMAGNGTCIVQRSWKVILMQNGCLNAKICMTSQMAQNGACTVQRSLTVILMQNG